MLNHVHEDCCHTGCFAVITLHPQEQRRLQRTGEQFYCPAGHGQSYIVGPTKEEKRIKELEQLLERRRVLLDDAYESRGEALARLREIAQAARICPLGCGWHTGRRHGYFPTEEDVTRYLDRVWGDLREHLVRDHNATLKPVALLEAGPQETA